MQHQGFAIGVAGGVFEKARIPVPIPAPIGVQSQVLLQPLTVVGARPLRVVSRDGGGGIFQRVEAVSVGAHEIQNPFDSRRFQTGGGVNQDQAGRNRLERLTDGNQ